jgi:transcription elongation factor Elf1
MPDVQTQRSGVYVFELRCPHCGKDSDVVVVKDHMPARLYCDECIRHHSEIVELKVVRVHIEPGE